MLPPLLFLLDEMLGCRSFKNHHVLEDEMIRAYVAGSVATLSGCGHMP
jgi:hypothetical protein